MHQYRALLIYNQLKITSIFDLLINITEIVNGMVSRIKLPPVNHEALQSFKYTILLEYNKY